MEVLADDPFGAYEARIITEIADHLVNPSPVRVALDYAGWPVERLMQALGGSRSGRVQGTLGRINAAVRRALVHTIRTGEKLTRETNLLREYARRGVAAEDAAGLSGRIAGGEISLEIMDDVADTYYMSNAVMLGAEGLGMGAMITMAEALPLMVPAAVAADVYASLTLLGRHAGQVAASYGFSPRQVENLHHVVESMAPLHIAGDTAPLSAEPDDNVFLATKAEVIVALRGAGRYLVSDAAQKEIPVLVKAIIWAAERIGLTVGEKELAALLPLVGAGLNATVNVAFQQTGHISAKDYFRRQILVRRYGDQRVDGAIAEAMRQAAAKKLPGAASGH